MAFPSSNVLNFHYDTATNKMTVYFSNNTKYEISNVPYYIYEEFLNSKSKGEFYEQKIKGVYEANKIY